MNRNMIITAILALLVLVSAVQAFQLTTLKAKVDAGALKIAGTKAATPAATAGTGAGGVSELPQMVGGC